MISYCRLRISLCNILRLRLSLCNILLKSLGSLFNLRQFRIYGLLCLLLDIAKTLTVFLGTTSSLLFHPPFLPPLSLKCFFCLSPLHQRAGTQCFRTVGVGNLRRGFPALLFRLKSLQSSIATWIKREEEETSTLLFSKLSMYKEAICLVLPHLLLPSLLWQPLLILLLVSLDVFPSYPNLVCMVLIY